MQKRFTPDEGGVFPEWEEVEFGKLFQRRSEKNGEEFGVEKTISVATMHFKPEGNKADEKSLPKYKVMRTGDIAFEGHINKHFKHGRFVLNDIGDGIISPIFEVLQPVSELSKEVPEFWKYYINYEPVMSKILAKCANTGIMMNRLAIKDFYKQKIKVPCVEEQRKIAAALAAYDEMIAVKTAKLETWQECKKRMVKEIFGRTKRFKDDDGNEFPEWEEKTLGEISEPLKYGMSAAAVKYDGENKYLRITDIDEASRKYVSDKIASPEASKIAEKFLVQKNDLLFARTGASVGKTYLYDETDGKMYYAGYLIKAHIKPEYDSQFIFQLTLTNEFKKWVKKESMRTAQPGINAECLAKYKMMIPCMEEQQKIGSFLAEIDKEIQIQKEFIKTYAEGKKRMMRELMEG